MQTILGATGIIGIELAKELAKNYTTDLRLVSRNPQKVNQTDELLSADLEDPGAAKEAVKDSEVVYFAVGLPYRSKIWQEKFPQIMRNVVNACRFCNARLVFFDNTYMYGKLGMGMYLQEEQIFDPQGKKAKVRSDMTRMLLNEMDRNTVSAIIARAPEFYGPGKTNSVTNALIFDRIKEGKKCNVLVSDKTKRTLIYTPDAAKATALLGNTPDAYGQTWHLPCDENRHTYAEFIKLTGEILGKEIEYEVLKPWMIKMAGLFNPDIRETIELLSRYEVDSLFDSTKFKKRFPEFKVTSYREGISKILEEME